MADQFATPGDVASIMQDSGLDLATTTLLIELATGMVQAAIDGQRLVTITDTALIPGVDDQWLSLPQHPVQSVATVLLDGVAVTDYKFIGQQLWRANGWLASWWEPCNVTVTSTHGYAVGAQYLQAARAATIGMVRGGLPNPGGVKSEAIDDYRVSYDEVAARMELTEFQRANLINAYGQSAYVTDSQ